MNLFGITVDIDTNSYTRRASLVDEVVSVVFKKNEERKIFNYFLASEMVDGESVLDSLFQKARDEAQRLVDETKVAEGEMLDFVLGELKRSVNSNLSLYEAIKRKIIETESPKFAKLHRLIDRGEFDGSLPLGYPDASKRADGFIKADIRDSLDKRVAYQFLERRALTSTIRELGKEVFVAINKLGLSGEEVVRYLRIIFELSLLETTPMEKPADLRRLLALAIKEGEALNLVHIKCLRFVYPIAGGFRVLTTQKDVVVDTILNQGKYVPKSEEELPNRITRVKEIFEMNGIKTNLTLIVADDDVDIYFPEGTGLATSQQIKEAKNDMEEFIGHLKDRFKKDVHIVSMSELVRVVGKRYQEFKSEVAGDIKKRAGKYVDPERFEKDRVDYLYDYFRERFGNLYTRDEARRCAIEKTANVISLQELLPQVGRNVVMVEENMGGENKLIANGSVPIIFVKLRDEAKFDVE